jgi:pantothenate kinase
LTVTAGENQLTDKDTTGAPTECAAPAVGEPPFTDGIGELLEHARALATRNQRTLLGITGAPGAGKSTLAHAIADCFGGTSRVVGMDGFHLPQARLAELGRLTRKGAIDTFDAVGFVALVRRLRQTTDETIYAPDFRRDLEESIADAVAIEPNVQLVFVEGNYLLIPDGPWGELRTLFDEIWYCERDDDARVADLIARHRAYGKSQEEAHRWALGPDQRNAEQILATRSRADRIVGLDAVEVADDAQPPRQACPPR